MTIPSLEQIADIVETLRQQIASIPGGTSPRVAIYGTGFLGRWAASWLPAQGLDLVACFDGNPDRTGSLCGSHRIQGPGDLEGIAPDITLITARHAIGPVSALLRERDIRHMPFEAYFVAQQFDSFTDVHEGLADEQSRRVLRAVLTAMATGDSRICEQAFEKDQYFCLPRFCGAEKEVFIDAGAYVGDSVERFIWTHYGVFEAIHAFEPGARQYRALKTRANRLIEEWALDGQSVTLNRCGLGAGEAHMAGGSQSGQLQSLALVEGGGATTEVKVTSLDAYLGGGRASFIKADVEGMEMALLEGARQTIATHRPKLAICVYHYPSDIPDITAYLRALVPDYTFALRHHSPQLMETVLYAWTD